MPKTSRPKLPPADIGERARMIRRRRGMSLAVTAGLAGISKSYLSMLESGERRFERRSLINNLAAALGCSVVDLTGEPYGPADRRGAEALQAVPEIQLALHDCTLDDVPDLPARPATMLADAVHDRMTAYLDQCRYDLAGRGLGALLTELQIIVATRGGEERQTALALLVEACLVAFGVTKNLGHPDLALEAARRGYEAARLSDDPALLGWASQRRAQALQRVGADRRAAAVLEKAIDALEPIADPSSEHTDAAEAYGLLHLTAAMNAARLDDADQADSHLDEATRLAARSGERNGMGQHFGPANVAVWKISVGVELGRGAAVEQNAVDVDFGILGSADRLGMLHVDLARALAQEGGIRDWEAVQHLDRADRLAPLRIRQDPVAREVLVELENRARIRTWELGSLRNRFGLN
ncbi:transcriptional regulator [Longimycelium tulufanense]|uniref:Transcriptional regulator n=1 Tax=Longimycelium tulufanense TaxID=907463 RepID=A0A8J3C7R1_9PSEU|nr:helix-turn-helix transcriptional regulator [Longimycelium tulufanense]GGM50927.1 transcriptional regulator [Longimycelium tulufanense]